jgi:diguanylate cyclase (GGDEF)-like protein
VQLSDELRRVANTDPLTGLYNQRYFHVVVGQELSRARRFGNTFSLLMFDLRNFRALNQRFGFDAGDEVLRNVGHAIAPGVRSIDTVCRYAADRFAVVLPEIERDVTTVQQKLAEALNTVTSPSGAGPVRAVFASVSYPKDGATEIDLVRLLLMRIDDVKQNSASATA